MDSTMQTSAISSFAAESAFSCSPATRADLNFGARESGGRSGNYEAVLTAMLDELDFGVCVCDAAAELVAANRSARGELAAGRALRLERGRIRPSPGGCQQSFDGALQDAARAGLRRMVSLGRGTDRLMVAVSPAGTDTATEIILIFGRRIFCSAPGLELLAGVHGLTYCERRVLAYLAAGERPAAISRTLGVSVYTVRSQIKSIREKFSVDSIDALLIRIAAIPPVIPALRRGNVTPPAVGVSISAF